MTPPERDRESPEAGRVAWERPTLTRIGNVKDLIRASGKTSDLVDSDSGGPPRKGRLLG